jgi:hypothetical protein
MRFTEWVIAAATVVSAGVATWYTIVTKRLWRTTEESVGLTRQSLELNREIYQATHRPILGFDVELAIENYTPPPASVLPAGLTRSGSVFAEFTYTIKNYGSDRATQVSFHVTSAFSVFSTNVSVGDLQPGEVRVITPSPGDCKGAIVKAWNEDVERLHHIKFEILVAYTWQTKAVHETINFALIPNAKLSSSLQQGSAIT